MDFQLNEEQLQLKKSVREFAEREIAPHVRKWDEAGDFPLSTIKELGKLGLMGVIFPSELGGAGMGYVEYVTADRRALARRRLGRHHRGGAHFAVLESHFSRRQRSAKAEIFPKLATGEFIGAWGLTEPASGSDAGSARMTAVRKGNAGC